ncbi:MAG: ArnT family glycosyltransferase [Acidobacteriota bacterium]
MRTPGTSHGPEASRTDLVLALVTLLLSFLYLCIFRRHTFLDLDEGIILQGAQRILDGQVLYRDFFAFVTPGSYYLLAIEFWLFGNTYLVAHSCLAVFGSIFAPITYLLARRVCGREASLLVTGLMTVTAVPLVFAVLHNWDSTLWACLALYCAVRLQERPRAAWAFAAASFTSLTILFEQSKGAGLLLGLTVGLLIAKFGTSDAELLNRKQMGAILAGLSWPFIITFIYFGTHHALAVMLADWLWPLQHYSAANRVPWGYGNISDEAQHMILGTKAVSFRLLVTLVYSATFWVPLLPILATTLFLRLSYLRLRNKAIPPEWGYYVLVSGTITGLMLSVMAGRLDYFHFMFLQPIFFVGLAWLLDGKSIRNKLITRVAPVVGLCVSLSLVAEASQLLFQAQTGRPVFTRRGNITMKKRDEVIERVQDFVAPRERILIYPYLSTYYYLTQTYSPTRYEYYQPGMHTFQQLDEMVADFSARPTRFVLYEPDFADHIRKAWPNTPAGALVRDSMADYIRREYRACLTLNSSTDWHFVFMVRKDLSCPNIERSSR